MLALILLQTIFMFQEIYKQMWNLIWGHPEVAYDATQVIVSMLWLENSQVVKNYEALQEKLRSSFNTEKDREHREKEEQYKCEIATLSSKVMKLEIEKARLEWALSTRGMQTVTN